MHLTMGLRAPIRLALRLLVAATVAGCAAQPRPLASGNDACEQCRMTVSDTRFGGEVISHKGRLRTFDSAECLAGYVVAAGDSLDKTKVFVADYETRQMVPAISAHFLRGGSVHSPMGRELVAFSSSHHAAELVKKYGGELLTWGQVLGDAAATQTPTDDATPRGEAKAGRS